MSKALSTIGTIAGIVAMIPSPIQPIAAAVAVVANVGAALTAKPPPATGSTSNVVIGSNLPTPYTMGRTYIGGNVVLDRGYGGEKNPYRTYVLEWSGGGPVEEIEGFYADFTLIGFSGGNATGYYNDFMYLGTQMGACPEPAALAGPFGAIPDWGPDYKLSGHAAGMVTLKFDKKGKRFASGVPAFGAILRGVLVYDPRQDSTYPGGAGACRPLLETSYVGGGAAENPGCHGVTYALGRWQNGKKVMGAGFAPDTIDWPAWVGFANMCDANGWKIGGTIYEPGSKWDNLKRICAAGGGEPMFVGGKLSVRYNAPRVMIDTITEADLADGEIVVPAMKTWRGRLNGMIPRYRSEQHKWEYVQSTEISVAAYIAEDGEEKSEERQIDLIQDKDQAAQVVTYELVNGREISGITLTCKPRLIEYRPGDALAVNVPVAGLVDQACVIVGSRVDPANCTVELTLDTETEAKHPLALGQTGTAPPTPTIIDPETRDGVVADNRLTEAQISGLINTSSVLYAHAGYAVLLGESGDPILLESGGRILLEASIAGLLTATETTITIDSHSRRYDDKTVAVAGGTLTGLIGGTDYHVYYDDEERAGGAVAYAATVQPAFAANSVDHPFRHYVGTITTDVAGGTGTAAGGATPPGWDPVDYNGGFNIP